MKLSRKTLAAVIAATMIVSAFSACSSAPASTTAAPAATTTAAAAETTAAGGETEAAATEAAPSSTSDSDRIIAAAQAGKVGNWGLGNEYEILALLTKYGQENKFLSQAFDMDGFDDDSITLASAMTYNELGLVQNSYEGGYGYGDTVGILDMYIPCSVKVAEASADGVSIYRYAPKCKATESFEALTKEVLSK